MTNSGEDANEMEEIKIDQRYRVPYVVKKCTRKEKSQIPSVVNETLVQTMYKCVYLCGPDVMLHQ